MRVLIYLGHPSQFHFFKNTVRILLKKNFDITIIIKTKDILERLVQESEFDYINIQETERKDNRISILLSLIKRDVKIYKIAKRFKPNLMLGSDPSIAHIGKLFGIPTITVLEDDYKVIKGLAWLTYPFTRHILVPHVCDVGKWAKKKIAYNGYMKLAYLHPNYFKPDINRISNHANTRYFLIRLSKLKAYHDFGMHGINERVLRQLISILSPFGKIYISTERDLPIDLKHLKLNINPKYIHHYLYHSHILIGDSQSMAVEAALLGVPSIRYSDFSGMISVLEELEHQYQLTFGIPSSQPEALFNRLNNLLQIEDLKNKWQEKRAKLIKDKIDVTSFLSWLIEHYPDSVKMSKKQS